jgi:glycosyltransferase involved in cell wall biosynthesis
MDHSAFPFISVVVPTYNRRKLLRDAIMSLFHQTYPDDRYEIIVVDNSSTDGTEEMMATLQQTSPCALRYFRKDNEGPGASRNMGVSQAKGPVIAFTDSDCAAEKNWLRNGVAKMTGGIGIVQGKTLPDPDQEQRTLQQTMKVLSEDGYYQTCNIFYLKEVVGSAGGFSAEFCGLNFFGKPRWGGEDTDLAWKVKKLGWKSVFADDAIVYHYIFPVASVKDLFRALHLDVIFILARIYKIHPEMRDILLYRKIFKSKQRALFYLFMLSLFPGVFIHWGFFSIGVPFFVKIIRESFYGRRLRSYHRGLALVFMIIIIELTESVLSIFSSLINRTIIL